MELVLHLFLCAQFSTPGYRQFPYVVYGIVSYCNGSAIGLCTTTYVDNLLMKATIKSTEQMPILLLLFNGQPAELQY